MLRFFNNLLNGFSTVLSVYPQDADLPPIDVHRSTESDWQVVGDDLRAAMMEFEKQNNID